MDDQIYQLIGDIYDAVIDPDRWPAVVAALRIQFEFHLAILSVVRLPAGAHIIQIADNVPPDALEAISGYDKEVPEL